jgi:hypothetical protein
MYIRRKVFSQAQDWDYGYENEMAEERLYSTGDVELDEILERAFCEGYEAAQREFGFKEGAKEMWEATKSGVQKGYNKVKDWGKSGYEKTKDYVGKHLGEQGTVAKKVSGWAEAGEKKIAGSIKEKITKLGQKYANGEISLKEYQKAVEKLNKGGNIVARGASKTLKAIKNNPRAAAAIAVGTTAAGIGAGVYAAKHRDEE